jgi:O-antigen/teichoic acid export membrane protein
VRLVKYGSVLSLWTFSMLLISGLDTVIVGHYDYKNTGFYAIASSATNVMLVLVSSVFGPLLPALSSMQARSTPGQLGELCIRITRYCVLVVCLLGLPLFFGSYPLLSLWVGRAYAAHSALYVEALVVGNAIRQLALPYSIAVVATGKQHLATISAVAEASVNIVLSIWLVQRLGAIGVAIGTVTGAIVGVAVHLLVSMPYTRSTILIERSRFLVAGLLRPLLITVPSLCLLFFWRKYSMFPAEPVILAIWVLLTLALAWWVGLTAEDRQLGKAAVTGVLNWRRDPV